MHIPPYHKRRSWQIFILGLLMGSLIAYFVLVFMYGKMYEAILTENIALQAEVRELTQQNEALVNDKEKLQAKSTLTVQTITIHFINEKQFRFDQLIVHQLNDLIKQELRDIIGKDVRTVSESSQLLISLIENKKYTVDDLSYHFIVRKLTIAEEMTLDLEVKFAP